MDTRIATLLEIRDEFQHEGLSAAVRHARAAYEAGQIDAMDIPEIFMALKSGSWRFLDQLRGRSTSPGRMLSTSTG
ncbi:hypothetical protein MASR2M8_14550 [Opitutaceae bacterium]